MLTSLRIWHSRGSHTKRIHDRIVVDTSLWVTRKAILLEQVTLLQNRQFRLRFSFLPSPVY
jgi:hypothetical protein